MVRAILAGTKTQTRRIVKPQPTEADWDTCRANLGGDTYRARPWVHPIFGIGLRRGNDGVGFPAPNIECPYGSCGDRLWVRETHAIESWTREFGDEPPLPADRPHKHTAYTDGDEVWRWPHYRATDPVPDLSCERDKCRVCESGEPSPHWKPSIHMPRWACRIVLEITDVRVERLQAISDEDAFAEGVEPCGHNGFHTDQGVCAYHALWDDINGAGAWDANPWVWALTFKRVTP
jgi:hypothetical protein